MQYYAQQTPFQSLRLYISNNAPQELIKVLEILSIWGGIDKHGDSYVSVEIMPYMHTACAKLLNYYQIQLTDSYDWIK